MKNTYTLIHFVAEDIKGKSYNGLTITKNKAEDRDDDVDICNRFANTRFYETKEIVKYARVLYKDVLEEDEDITRQMLSKYILSTLGGGIVI